MVGQIRIDNVQKKFINPDGSEVVALNDLSFTVKPGSFVSLIGPSGCGKTTLLRAIAGLNLPDRGGIYLDGEKITKAGADRGYAFQQANLFPWLNIRNNMAFGLKARGEYKEKKENVDQFLKAGVDRILQNPIHTSFQEECVREQHLPGHPKVLLLDEPLGALDAFTRMNMQDMIMDLWKKHNMTMIMVTHDVDEAIYLSDQVVVMSARPAKVEQVINIDLSRPRKRGQDVFMNYRKEILEILNFAGNLQDPDYYL